MVIIETSVFTRQIQKLLTDEDYAKLQADLVRRPDAGVVIPGSGGLRKLRWGLRGRGKRGGVRIIYYWAVSRDQLLMLLMYPKNVQDDLTPEQLRTLRRIVETEYP
jgi:mRNA-degrading endonuclease RelE of RelBE toxin-antitoxin system